MTTKLNKVMAYDIRLSRTKSHDSLITRSYVVSGKTKNVISPFPQVLWTSTLTEW